MCACCCAQQDKFDNENHYLPPNGLSWDKVLPQLKAPQLYDPPQLKPGYIPCYRCNWIAHRSPLLARPAVPCCCMHCIYCINPGTRFVDITTPDEWFAAMLSTGTSPKFNSSLLGGIYWMDGNFAPEVLMTFHDANWISPTVGLKLGYQNWTHDLNCFGSFMATGTANACSPLMLRLEISPDGKWMVLNTMGAREKATGDNTIWMYRIQPGDKFFDASGEQVSWAPGDWVRLTWEDPWDVSSPLTYQYMVRRVAYLDGTGRLVKTAAYEKLLHAATAPPPYPTTCCGYGYCNLTPEQFPQAAFSVINHQQAVLLAPPPPGSMDG